MLSRETVMMMKECLTLQSALYERIKAETDGKYSIASMDYIHIIANAYYDPTVEQFSADLGNVNGIYPSCTGQWVHYNYNIDGVPCVTLLNLNPKGGWADEAKANQEA